MSGEKIERLLGVCGDKNLVVLKTELTLQRIQNALLVVDHKQIALLFSEEIGRQALFQIVGEELQAILRWERAGVIVALHFITAGTVQKAKLFKGFDAFGNDLDAQVMPNGNHRTGQRRGIWIQMYVVDETLVDFQLAERKALQVAKRRITGAEIVDGKANTQGAE